MSVRRTLAAALAAGVLLAGCSDDPEPTFEPPASPSPSESETSSAEPEAQSPEEFIREWFELNTEMQNSGETDEFLRVSRGCRPCSGLAKRVKRIYGDGGFIEIASQDVVEMDLGSRSSTIKQFDVVVQTAPTRYRESEGADLANYDGGRATYQLTIIREGDTWRMDNVLAAG
jgi:hypothetical protein